MVDPQPADSPLARLALAHAATGTLVRSVPADRWSAPTPCEDWDVAGLVRHLVAGERIFAALIRDGRADRDAILPTTVGLPVADLPATYDADAAALRAAYAEPGAMERSCLLPIGELTAEESVELRIAETLTHGWDLGQVLDRPLPVADALAERTIASSRDMLERLPPGRTPFGTPQPVADDAPALDRLVALLGRTVP